MDPAPPRLFESWKDTDTHTWEVLLILRVEMRQKSLCIFKQRNHFSTNIVIPAGLFRCKTADLRFECFALSLKKVPFSILVLLKAAHVLFISV